MKWYSNYLSVYNQSYDSVLQSIKEKIRHKLVAQDQLTDPVVSIVLIAHNEEKHIVSCIWSLLENHHPVSFELFVVNNNSIDATESILRDLGVRYYNETKKGPGFARQSGLNHAKGKYHLCIDSDTIYPPYYVQTHLKKLMQNDVVCTYSLWSFMSDKDHGRLGLFFYELLRDIHLNIQSLKRPELCVRGMTFGFKTDLARKFGFRTDIIRGEDGSLALAMKSCGKLVFIRSRKARVLTGNDTLNSKGSLFNNLLIRIKKAICGFSSLFTSKEKYEDTDSNLINKKN